MAGDETPAIHTQDLAKKYGHVTALAGLTMTVPKGEVFGFLGPNGAGKTTSVKLLLGLTEPSAGQAWLLGAPIGNLAVRRRVGYLPELFRYQGFLTAREVSPFTAISPACLAQRAGRRSLRRSPWSGSATAATIAADLLEGNAAEAGPRGGAARQARADLPRRADLGLDPVGRHDVREITRRLRERGTTIFLNSHLLTEVEMVCDRVAVVDTAGHRPRHHPRLAPGRGHRAGPDDRAERPAQPDRGLRGPL